MKNFFLVLLAFIVLQGTAMAQVAVSGEITANTTWTKNNTYLLNGFVYVKNGATLTIEPGTVIKGDKASRGTLIVTRGAKVIANGTKDEPIVFTSNQASPKTGDWGGIVLLGYATANSVFTPAGGSAIPGLGQIEGDINNAAGDGLYGGGDQAGGPNDNDNSGVLRYVRIEYPGIVITTGNEINGLTMGGVGRGTTIEYVQVSYSNDDSYEWFGGTVNCRYLIAYRGLDDDFDTDNGFSGNIQFALAVRDSSVYDGAGASNGFESDNDASGTATLPKTRATFSNVTLIGPSSLVAGNTFGRGALLRRNTEESIFNTVILGQWPTGGVRIDAQSTTDNAVSGALEVKNTHVAGVATAITSNGAAPFVPLDWFNTTGWGNSYNASASALGLTDPYNLANPNALPTPSSPVFGGASFTATRLQDPFFIDVTYAGAFGQIDWTCGWSKFQGGVNTCDIEVVSGNITTNTTWKSDRNYVLNGFVYVKNGATLTIEPGTTIKGDKASRGTLIITRGSKIIADGTRVAPIVFTSSQPVGQQKTGDWGGIVMLGRAQTNSVFTPPGGTAVAGLGQIEGDINNAAGDGLYGGGDLVGGAVNTDNSGILRYVRIEYPGIVITTGNEINGLTMGGVGSGTTIDYVEVLRSNDDSFEWFGGTVNAKHLIAYAGVDDDFDTDNGFSGNIQFALGVRDPLVFDGAGASNGFESDNDASGTATTPKTRATFSNVTLIGPATLETGNTFGRAALLRRNTEESLFNSLFLGQWPTGGVRIDAQSTTDNATSGKLEVKNVATAGVAVAANSNGAAPFVALDWFNTTGWGNLALPNATDLALVAPYTLAKPSALPSLTTPAVVLEGASFTSSTRLQNPAFEVVKYHGAFGLTNGVINDWTCQWARFDAGFNNCLVGTVNFEDLVNSARLAPTVAFNTTNLQIDVKENLDLIVSIYSMNGQLMGTQVNESIAAGEHTFNLNVSNYPAGLYFVQILAGESVKTEKLIIAR